MGGSFGPFRREHFSKLDATTWHFVRFYALPFPHRGKGDRLSGRERGICVGLAGRQAGTPDMPYRVTELLEVEWKISENIGDSEI